jgi:hypothetical protein
MELEFSAHCLFEMSLRQIEKADVELVIVEPDKTLEGRFGRKIFQKVIEDNVLQKPMLYRVVVEEAGNVYSVITVYKTSNFKKYM